MRSRLFAPTMFPDARVPVIRNEVPSAAAPILKLRRERDFTLRAPGEGDGLGVGENGGKRDFKISRMLQEFYGPSSKKVMPIRKRAIVLSTD